jgi:hypothetical protein
VAAQPAPVAHDHAAPAPAAPAKAPSLADAKGVDFEKFAKVDPTLPAVPPGAVKKFTVDVLEHVTQVDPNLAPTDAWSYAVNGKAYRGTAASPPIVVNQGDKVRITFVNGGSKKMAVSMAHSIDFHSAEVPRTRTTSTWRPASGSRSTSPPSTPACSCTTAPPSPC